MAGYRKPRSRHPVLFSLSISSISIRIALALSYNELQLEGMTMRSKSPDDSDGFPSHSDHSRDEEIQPLAMDLPRYLPTIEVLALGINVQIDQAYECPNNNCSRDSVNSRVSDLPYEALRREAGRGCPRCILYCNMIIAFRPHSRIDKTQNPHRWTNPFGKNQAGDDVVGRSPRDIPVYMRLQYANCPNIDPLQRINVFALNSKKL